MASAVFLHRRKRRRRITASPWRRSINSTSGTLRRRRRRRRGAGTASPSPSAPPQSSRPPPSSTSASSWTPSRPRWPPTPAACPPRSPPDDVAVGPPQVHKCPHSQKRQASALPMRSSTYDFNRLSVFFVGSFCYILRFYPIYFSSAIYKTTIWEGM